MKLSEAIRLGAMLRPQAFGMLFRGGGSCALAAAYEAAGLISPENDWTSERPWPILRKRAGAICPVNRCSTRWPLIVGEVLVHLNNDHHWTRERIADWVASVEPQNSSVTGDAVSEQTDALASPVRV